jgi:hypothetical protein
MSLIYIGVLHARPYQRLVVRLETLKHSTPFLQSFLSPAQTSEETAIKIMGAVCPVHSFVLRHERVG